MNRSHFSGHDRFPGRDQNENLAQSLSLITIETAEKEDLNELDITELFTLAAKGEFPRKVFIFDKLRYSSTPRLNFLIQREYLVNVH